MPIFDLKCKKCGLVYQDFLCTGPAVVQKCTCGSTEFEKIPAAPALRFNGDGFQTPRPREDKGSD